jgi:group I intron endonuclease
MNVQVLQCFIYKITSPTKKVYVGSTINIKKRFDAYKKLNCKRQPKLYASFLKHGVENHLFDIIIPCHIEDMLQLEAFYGKQFDVISKKGLNLSLPKTGDTYRNISNETRKKISQSKIGKKRSNDTKLKLRLYRLGKKASEETKIKMRLSSPKTRGKLLETTKEKIRQKAIGRKLSDEHKAKISPLGRNHSEQTKLKMSISMTGLKRSDEARKKMSEGMMGNKNGKRVLKTVV